MPACAAFIGLAAPGAGVAPAGNPPWSRSSGIEREIRRPGRLDERGSEERLFKMAPQFGLGVHDRLGAAFAQGLGAMIAPGDADRADAGVPGYSHVEGRIPDHDAVAPFPHRSRRAPFGASPDAV